MGLFFVTGPQVQVRAHYCDVGRERDGTNEWRWVLPYEDPCTCTSVRFGGMNVDTPERHFKLTYEEEPLISVDIEEIRDHFGLRCEGKICVFISSISIQAKF